VDVLVVVGWVVDHVVGSCGVGGWLWVMFWVVTIVIFIGCLWRWLCMDRVLSIVVYGFVVVYCADVCGYFCGDCFGG